MLDIRKPSAKPGARAGAGFAAGERSGRSDGRKLLQEKWGKRLLSGGLW